MTPLLTLFFLTLTVFADSQAALQLVQGDGPVLVQVAVVGELACTFLGFGLFLQVSLKRFQLLFVDLMAAVQVQLCKVPVHHAFLQCVSGVRLHKPVRNGSD